MIPCKYTAVKQKYGLNQIAIASLLHNKGYIKHSGSPPCTPGRCVSWRWELKGHTPKAERPNVNAEDAEYPLHGSWWCPGTRWFPVRVLPPVLPTPPWNTCQNVTVKKWSNGEASKQTRQNDTVATEQRVYQHVHKGWHYERNTRMKKLQEKDK